MRMNRKYLLLFFVIVFSSLCGCAGLKQVHAGTVTFGIETLILRDAGNGWTVGVGWCGNDTLLLDGSKAGVALLDLKTMEKKVILEPDDELRLVGCTPDVKRVVYALDTFIPNPTYEEYDGPDENPYQPRIPVSEVYRYDIATGESDKFADTATSMHNLSEWLSPDGNKIFLMPWHESGKENTAEWLEHVSFANDQWDPANLSWFPDSSGVAAYLDYPYSGLGVEFFGEHGWSKVFKVPGEVAYKNITPRWDGVIYYDSYDAIHRCKLKDKGLLCEEVVNYTCGNGEFIAGYDVLSDGDILFQGIYDKCIRRISPGEKKAGCVIDTRYGEERYRNISGGSISPDGKRMVFVRSDYVSTPYESYINYRADLFIIELTDN